MLFGLGVLAVLTAFLVLGIPNAVGRTRGTGASTPTLVVVAGAASTGTRTRTRTGTETRAGKDAAPDS